jgi:Zn-finger protein
MHQKHRMLNKFVKKQRNYLTNSCILCFFVYKYATNFFMIIIQWNLLAEMQSEKKQQAHTYLPIGIRGVTVAGLKKIKMRKQKTDSKYFCEYFIWGFAKQFALFIFCEHLTSVLLVVGMLAAAENFPIYTAKQSTNIY